MFDESVYVYVNICVPLLLVSNSSFAYTIPVPSTLSVQLAPGSLNVVFSNTSIVSCPFKVNTGASKSATVYSDQRPIDTLFEPSFV